MVEKYFYAQVCAFVPNLTGSIYPTEAPQKTPLPYGVYNCTGSSMNTTLTIDTLFSETLQLDIYAETYKESKGGMYHMEAELMLDGLRDEEQPLDCIESPYYEDPRAM
jgi:hypothetical protein